MNPTVQEVTQRIAERSRDTRSDFLRRMREAHDKGPNRQALSCSNLAHGYAACGSTDKQRIRAIDKPNLGIVTAYNDVISSHQPMEHYPEIIRQAAREVGCTAQVAGGVPAMCDGVTQGQPGMELSLFSREVIAAATAVSLSHDMFDAVLCLGTCDKIVPGLFAGAMVFGHLPVVFVPSGPMPTGMSNAEKAKTRELFAKGEIGEQELLTAESKSYHGAGVCTFYGTANTNQMVMEFMGLHLPGSSFVNPNTPLREALTREAALQATRITRFGPDYTPMGEMIDEKAVVNSLVGLLATGGSTNHTMHIISMARAGGIILNWDDFSDLSRVVPLLARVYPNGSADVNAFHAAGGLPFVIRELLKGGLLHGDVRTIVGKGLQAYTQEPFLRASELGWRPAPEESRDAEILTTIDKPFSAEGGLRLLDGNLGRGVIKISAVAPEHRLVEAPCVIFHDQEGLQEAFKAGKLNRDVIAVVRFQGPRATGMPELHKLTPPLAVLQGLGHKVALVTDGRMSGASGKVPAAIHMTPEALGGGPLARLRDGDVVRLDAEKGTLEAKVPEQEWADREPATADLTRFHWGTGRELFDFMRARVSGAEDGATVFFQGE